MGATIAAIYNALLAVLNSGIARSLAMKIFIKAMLLILIPYLLMKGFNNILQMAVEYQVAEMQSITNPTSGISSMQMTGLASYLFVQCGCNVAISSIVSALSFRWIIHACQRGWGGLYYF